MNSKTITTVFTITVSMTILCSASIVPAFAATKVADIQNRQTESGTDNICGVDVNYNVVLVWTYTEWDNGHFTEKGKAAVVFTDITTGKLVGKLAFLYSIQGNVSDLQYTEQYNEKVTCVGTGLVDNIHLGITIHRDGSITAHHED